MKKKDFRDAYWQAWNKKAKQCNHIKLCKSCQYFNIKKYN